MIHSNVSSFHRRLVIGSLFPTETTSPSSHLSSMLPVSTLFLTVSIFLLLAFSLDLSLFFSYLFSGLSLISFVSLIASADLFGLPLVSFVSLIAAADFFGLPLLLISLFKLMFKLMRSPGLFISGFSTSIDNTLFAELIMGLDLLTVVKITLRPALSFGLPFIEGGVSLSTEREEVSGASPFGESDDDLS